MILSETGKNVRTFMKWIMKSGRGIAELSQVVEGEGLKIGLGDVIRKGKSFG